MNDIRKRTGNIWVVNLDISQAIVVENLQFGLIRLRNVCEILRIIRVNVPRVCSSLLIPHMVPFRCSHSDLTFTNSLLRHDTLQVVPLVDVGASNVLDLASADDAFSGLVTCLGEGGDVWHVHAEDVNVWVLDLFEAFHSREESAPKHCQTGSAKVKHIHTGKYTLCRLYSPSDMGWKPNLICVSTISLTAVSSMLVNCCCWALPLSKSARVLRRFSGRRREPRCSALKGGFLCNLEAMLTVRVGCRGPGLEEGQF